MTPFHKHNRFQLAAAFSLCIFFTLTFTTFTCFAVIFILHKLGLIAFFKGPFEPILIFAVSSIIVGTVFSLLFSKRPLRPMYQIISATDRVANGDYSVRLNLPGPHVMSKVSTSFNHMTEELASVELLRSDFVNNFSHEFKTPIVSISGFAKMLKRDDLTPEERNEYLDIIINESARLTELSTNVLTLSKMEKQIILTDTSRFNLSEQIRLAIIMVAAKWPEKNIDFDFDSEEIYIEGNLEILKQVWINLLDNSVKFAPEGSTVRIRIIQNLSNTIVSFTNKSEELSEEALSHIFDKFYQADTSHTVKGNGLGLTIARRALELHNGTIAVKNSTKRNYNNVTFEATLPR